MSQPDSNANRRYKLLSAALAAVVVFLLVRDAKRALPETAPAQADIRRPTSKAMAARQLRASARTFGLSEPALIAELRANPSAARVATIGKRLEVIGTDRSLDVLSDLVMDNRSGVANIAIETIGSIGTRSAVRFLLGFEKNGIARMRYRSIVALGLTGADDAVDRLIEVARDDRDGERFSAITALGQIGSADVVATFAEMIDGRLDHERGRVIVRALASIDRADSHQLLVELANSALDLRVREMALDYLELSATDEGARAALMTALMSPLPTLVATAAKNLARIGDRGALPRIEALARGSGQATQSAAIEALGLYGDRHEILAELLERGTPRVREKAADALASMADEEAIDIIVSAASRPRSRHAALSAMRYLHGPKIENAMVEIAASGTRSERLQAKDFLIGVGHQAGLDMIAEIAHSGTDSERSDALRSLANSGSPEALDLMREMVSTTSGSLKIEAISNLIAAGDHTHVGELRDLLLSGDSSVSRDAAKALATAGGSKATDALLEGLASDNGNTVAMTAMAALDSADTPAMRAALLDAAKRQPVAEGAIFGELLEVGASEAFELAAKRLGGNRQTIAETAQALAYADTPETNEVLFNAKRSDNPTTRAEVARALGQVNAQGRTDALRELVKDSDEDVRSNAISSLGSDGSSDAISTLESLLSENAEGTRLEAASALARAETERARELSASIVIGSDDALALVAIRESPASRELGVAWKTVLADPNRSAQLRGAAAKALRYAELPLSDTETALIEELNPDG